ncbi:MAG: hypothetical protein V3V08_21245 [Nannocystaceae bacterium]
MTTRNPKTYSRPAYGRHSLRRGRGLLALLALLPPLSGWLPSSTARAVASDDLAAYRAFDADLGAWDLAAAKDVVTAIRNPAQRELREGILEFYESDYEAAHARLAALLAAGTLDETGVARAERVLALTRGALDTMGDAIVIKSADGKFEAAFANTKDTILAPYLFEAMDSAYQALGDDLGVFPRDAIRFEFLDSPADLAKITPLTLDNVYTTGTVGITKYRRIMMVTPRVMLYGYGWIDTAVHEYVHYVATMRTRNRAPVWLQEGLAKLFESRWRASAPLPLEDPVQALLHQAIVTDTLVTLDEMQPSIAMLPSQERATLAYAEVETMLGFLLKRRGEAGLAVLIDRVTDGERAEDALGVAWGESFDSFYAAWKESTRKATARSEIRPIAQLQFLDSGDRPEHDGAQAPDPSLLGDIFSHLGGGKARQHARLGVLLTLRGHKLAATVEYEKARSSGSKAAKDPALARRLGELLLELGHPDKASPLLDLAAAHDSRNANLSEAQARAALATGQLEKAKHAAERALRVNPFIPLLHCDLAALAQDDATRTRELSLCPVKGVQNE